MLSCRMRRIPLKGLFGGHNRLNSTLSSQFKRKAQKVCFLFPGMGSHYVGMCKDLAKDYKYIHALLDECDDMLGYKLSNTMFDGDVKTLSTVKYGGMAMFIHSMCIWRILQTEYDIDNIFNAHNIEATIIGHSMGEMSAVTAGGLFKSFADALYITHRFSEANRLQSAPNQGMCVVMSNPKDIKEKNILNNMNDVVQICESNNIDIANINSPNQIVLSGYKTDLELALNQLNNADHFDQKLKYKHLDIAGGHHSYLMKPTFDTYFNDLINMDFNPELKCDLYLNALGHDIKYDIKNKNEKNNEGICYLLAKQLYSRVHFYQCIKHYIEKDEDADAQYVFVEIGPRKVLQQVVQQILTYHDYNQTKSVQLMSIENTKTIPQIEHLYV